MGRGGRAEGPIGTVGGVTWFVACLLVVSTGVLLAARWRWWWAVGAIAVTVSQIVIVTAWSDAWAGTIANVILLLAVVYGFAANGPTGARAEYRRLVGDALADAPPSGLVDDDDLARLPAPVAGYVRRSGAVGQPRVKNFRAQIHGRIRSGPDAAWMPFTGRQVNTYGPRPQRVFLMDATRSGLPVTVLHVFTDTTATMRVKLLSLFTVVDASGPEMDRGETVTVFNDLVVMAPGAIVDAPATWETIDDLHVRGTFTDGGETVSATLTFNAEHDLVDFVSDDRFRSIDNGARFVAQRWSTPIDDRRTFGSRRAIATGSGRWHAPEPEGEFPYLEIEVDAINYNVTADMAPADRTPSSSTGAAQAVTTPERHQT